MNWICLSMCAVIVLLCCLSLSLLQMSCTSNSPTQAYLNTSYGIIPLRVGNRWSLQRFDAIDTLGTMLPGDTSNITILKDTLANNQAWFQTNIPWPYGYTYTNRSSGCYLRGWYNNVMTSDFQEYKYPASPSETYFVPIVYVAADSVWLHDSSRIVTVLSTDTLVKVPAGTFHCYQFRFQYNYQGAHPNSGEFYDDFLSPGLGWVVKNYYGHTASGKPELRTTLVLKSFQIQ